jgi:hypothetical protein
MNEQSKSTPWKIIIPVAVVVILCCICLVAVGGLAYLGMQGQGPLSMLATATSTATSTSTPTPTKIPTRTPTATLPLSIKGEWDLYYDWSCSGSYNGPASVTFYTDGTYYAIEGSSGGYGTWTLTGNALDYIYDDYPHAHYIGTVNSTGDYVEGTMSTDDGSNGCWYAYPSIQGSIITPAPAFEDNIYGDWDLYYDWSCSGSYNGPVAVTFYTDGTYYAVEDSSGGYGTWTLIGNALDYLYDDYPHAHYIGTINSARDYGEGTMSTDDGSNGCWYANKR